MSLNFDIRNIGSTAVQGMKSAFKSLSLSAKELLQKSTFFLNEKFTSQTTTQKPQSTPVNSAINNQAENMVAQNLAKVKTEENLEQLISKIPISNKDDCAGIKNALDIKIDELKEVKQMLIDTKSSGYFDTSNLDKWIKNIEQDINSYVNEFNTINNRCNNQYEKESASINNKWQEQLNELKLLRHEIHVLKNTPILKENYNSQREATNPHSLMKLNYSAQCQKFSYVGNSELQEQKTQLSTLVVLDLLKNGTLIGVKAVREMKSCSTQT